MDIGSDARRVDVKLPFMTRGNRQQRHGTKGRVNKMSDDLISRKALIETLKGQYENARKMRYSGQFYEYWAGRMDSYRDAIKIVEKGGIE